MDKASKQLLLSYLKDYNVSVDDEIGYYHKQIDENGGLSDYIVRMLEYWTAKKSGCVTLKEDVENGKIGDLREYVRAKSNVLKGFSDFYWDIYQILRFK